MDGMQTRALVNLFTRLINQKRKTMDEVPEHLREEVKKQLASTPPSEPREGEEAETADS